MKRKAKKSPPDQHRCWPQNSLPLFANCGISVPESIPVTNASPPNKSPQIAYIKDRMKNEGQTKWIQLTLSAMFCEPSTPITSIVTRLLPLRKQVYLDESVFQVFSAVPSLREIGYKLASPPYRCDLLGFLIQMSEEEVLETFPFIDSSILDLMKDRLATAGLGFGTRVPPFWRRPLPAQSLSL